MTQRMRAKVTAKLYIQNPSIMISIAATIGVAIFDSVMVTDAPWCNVFHHFTEK